MIFATLKRCVQTAAALGALAAMNGCSTTAGQFVPQSQFVYPNSNVTALGPTKAHIKRTYFYFWPEITTKDIHNTYNRALANVNGANILVDYKENTTVGSFFFFNSVTYSLEGEAAKMEVGRKELK